MGLFSRSFDPIEDVPDLHGKVVLVTGGNAGIGYAVIQHLARRGAKVYMAARNEQKAQAAIDKLTTEGLAPGNGEVLWHKLDLSDPRDVKESAEDFLQKEQRLDILVNNAALLLLPFQKTHDGVQDIVMVNYVGTFVFTRALLPLLKRTALQGNNDVRIVNVSSSAQTQCPNDVRFRNLDDFNRDFASSTFPRLMRYSLSKLMQLMFLKELQSRLDAEGVPILCIGVDPGPTNTDGAQNYAQSAGPILAPIYSTIANLLFSSPAKASLGTVFAAASPVPRERSDEYKGAFLNKPASHGPTHPAVQDSELRRELWATTEEILKNAGVELPDSV
ncbi:NAD-P-binding protein [Trametes polyzona]|nr:NAD-P-binding protein [Trametes polyzona]